MGRTYALRDVEAWRRAYLRTFSIPRREVRRALEPGWFVKLVFELPRVAEDGCDAERMWCEVIARRGRGYVGRLDNQPRYVERLASGDEVRFEPRHVAALETGSRRKLGALVGVGVDVLRHEKWPTWIAHVTPANPQDSGWRVFSAREARDGAIVRALSTQTLFRSWAVTDQAIGVASDGVWHWDRASLEYVRAPRLPPKLATAAAAELGRLHAPAPGPSQLAVITRRALTIGPSRAQYFGPAKDDDDDSGWVIYVGDESQSHLDDPKNSTLVPVARLLHLYPYLERVLGETRRTTWAWDDEHGDWQPARPRRAPRRTARRSRRPTPGRATSPARRW